jgi:hypothetical protein
VVVQISLHNFTRTTSSLSRGHKIAQWRKISILACTKIVSWGSLYYAFSILLLDIHHELKWCTTLVFSAHSWSLLIAGLVATPIGILLDRRGGQAVMGADQSFAAFVLSPE